MNTITIIIDCQATAEDGVKSKAAPLQLAIFGDRLRLGQNMEAIRSAELSPSVQYQALHITSSAHLVCGYTG